MSAEAATAAPDGATATLGQNAPNRSDPSGESAPSAPTLSSFVVSSSSASSATYAAPAPVDCRQSALSSGSSAVKGSSTQGAAPAVAGAVTRTARIAAAAHGATLRAPAAGRCEKRHLRGGQPATVSSCW